MKAEHADLTIWEALAHIQRHAPPIAKTEEVDTTKDGGKIRYSFAGFNTVWDSIADLMDDLGFVWSCATEIEKLDGGHSRFILRATLYHLPTGEKREAVYPLVGDTPQKIGSGMTYGRRYLLVALLNLRVVNDDDAQAAEERAQLSPSQQAQASRTPRKTAQKATPRPREAPPQTPDVDPEAAPALSRKVQAAMFAALGELGLTERGPIMEYVNETLAKHGAPAVESRTQLSDESAGWIIERAKAADAGPPNEEG